MSVYSGNQIKAAIERDATIVCHPFRPEQVNLASLDVTLGYHYFRTSEDTKSPVRGLSDERGLRDHLDGPCRAMPHQEWCGRNGYRQMAGIPPEHPVISLGPKERIVAHSHEFIGIASGTAELRARTDWSKNGIIVTLGTNWIEPGRVSRLMFEIYNANERATVLLPVGERIAQVVFWHSAPEATKLEMQDWNVPLRRAIKVWSPARLCGYRSVGH